MPEFNLIASSNEQNSSLGGSSFIIEFGESVKFPSEAKNMTLTVESAIIWWSVPNIIENQNDKFFCTGPDLNNVIQSYVVTVPQGLYDLPGISEAITNSLENQGARLVPEPLVSFAPDNNTNRVLIRLNYVGVSVDFTQPQTIREILGFDSVVLVRPPIIHTAANIAAFNTVNYFLVHSDLVSAGLRYNDAYYQVITQVSIDVSPGSQIVSEPFLPPRVDCQNLAGARLTRCRFWLSDDQNRTINTNGENWSVRISIKWE